SPARSRSEESTAPRSMPAEAARMPAVEAARTRAGDSTRGDGPGPNDRRAGPRDPARARGHDDAGPGSEHVGRGPGHPAGMTPAMTRPDGATAETVPAPEAVSVPGVTRPSVDAEVRARTDAPDPRGDHPAPAVRRKVQIHVRGRAGGQGSVRGSIRPPDT